MMILDNVGAYAPYLSIIAGGATNKLAPLDNNEYEKWCLNDFYSVIPSEKVDVWFELHDYDYLRLRANRFNGKPYLDGLKDIKSKKIMTQNSFPYKQLVNHFGAEYFHNSICYMIAYAIMLNRFKKIYLFGVDNIKPIEIFKCLMYWIGQAESHGIEVVIPEQSMLFKTPKMYGRGDT